MVEALGLIDGWEVQTAAAGVVWPGTDPATHGASRTPFPLASVTKPLFAYAVLVAVEEGSVDFDGPAGPPGATVRHLLAHTSGLGFDTTEVLAAPGKRRIYSNTGFEELGRHLAERTGLSEATYLREAVLAPLAMAATTLEGSPAADAHSSIDDLVRFATELLAPTLVSPSTLAEATGVAFPGLAGVLPGVGRFDPLDWGLGMELRGTKQPHWTGRRNSPRTFGHFGARGTFLWVDPDAAVACAALTDRDFGPWALEVWPVLSDAVLTEAGMGSLPPDPAGTVRPHGAR